ncbi:MAG: UDP-N-acetylmuramoylalanyl-D-glutamyl-2,6-diaminopimelate--D-alanyl-D-alanine ligase [Alphaproteobacteria bacterium]|nr:UDP-N-acetylmuramoylalanyl-D-glutamyl-2,6-diaminopimelate--D-alanyl-D-alanine ligase [Alphaproteobacteria bacterium]
MSVLWTAQDILAATGGRGRFGGTCGGVSIDSRTVDPGDLFVALRGPTHDGHDFVAAALTAGAVAALVSRQPTGVADEAPLIAVADTQVALEQLAAAARARSAATVIGITGSVGKTGTKEALRRALEGQGPTHASAASFNNQWGVPLSLARMPADTTYGIFELGMNHPGEIGALSRQVRPHIAVITTVEPAHLEFFSSVAAIADAKAEIFAGMTAAGIAVLNQDNPYFERLAEAARRRGLTHIYGFGEARAAWARLSGCTLHPDRSCVTAEIGGQALLYRIGAPGRHWVINSLAVLAVARLIGADPEVAARALAALRPPKGRGERHTIHLPDGSFELIDESYNASPVSMRAALQLLAAAEPGAGGLRIAVLGDMRELGPRSDRLHAALAPDVVTARADMVFAAGPHMVRLFEALPTRLRGHHAAESKALVPLVIDAVRAGDVVMVKGSLGSRMGMIVEALKVARDRPVVAAVG